MRSTLKRLAASILALVMVFTMLPVSALAADVPTVTMNTAAITDGTVVDNSVKWSAATLTPLSGELTVGTKFYVPVMLSAELTQFSWFNFAFEYTDALKYIGSKTNFVYDRDGDPEDPQDFARSLTYGSELTDNVAGNNVSWALATGVTNDGTTPVIYAGFEVIAKSATGEETITVKSKIEGQSAIGNTDEDVNLATTYVAGKVYVEKNPEATTFSVTNGAQSWTADTYSELQTIMTNGSGLTAPGTTGYYFAGFFSGLEADDNYITVDESGYYVLSAAAIGSTKTQSFAGVTEWRPRYDAVDASTVGNYNALWLRNDISGQAVISSMQVLNAGGIAVTVYASADDTALPGHAVTMLNADFTAVGGDGYVKLLTDVKPNEVVEAENVNLDMNGHSLINADGFAVAMTNGSVVSSYGKGTVEAKCSFGYYGIIVKGNASVIRDIGVVGTIRLAQSSTLTLLENCTVDQETVTCIELQTGAEISEISNCEITGAYAFYLYNDGTAQPKVLKVHDTTIAQPADGIYKLIRAELDETTASAKLQLGEGTTLKSASFNELLAVDDTGWLTVEFTDTDVTMTSTGGNPLPEKVGVYEYILPDGYVIQQGSGKAELLAGSKVTYMSYDGTETIALEYVGTGNAASLDAYVVSYPLVVGDSYKHIGWSTQQYATEPLSSLVPTGEVTLYPVRQACGIEEVATVKLTVGTVASYYDSLDEAIAYAFPVTSVGWVQEGDKVTEQELTVPTEAVIFDILKDTSMNGNSYCWGCYMTDWKSQYAPIVAVGDSDVTFDLHGNTLTVTDYYTGYAFASGTGSLPFTLRSTGGIGTIVVSGSAAALFEDASKVTTTGYTLTNDGKVYTLTPEHVHAYGEPDYGWNGTTLTVTLTCGECAEGTEGKTLTGSADGTVQSTTEGDCKTAATTTYTATVNLNGTDYTNTTTIEGELGDHNYVDGSCTICDGADPDYTPAIDTDDIFENKTGTTTPATITAPADGWAYGAENTFTVTCDKACVVAYTTDSETYIPLTATDDGYTVSLTEGMRLVVALVGDVDGNGLVRIADVIAAAQLEASAECTSYQKLLADMNGDGNLRIADVIALAQLVNQA